MGEEWRSDKSHQYGAEQVQDAPMDLENWCSLFFFTVKESGGYQMAASLQQTKKTLTETS